MDSSVVLEEVDRIKLNLQFRGITAVSKINNIL